MTDETDRVPPSQQCFLCFGKLRDGRDTVTVGLGFEVHRECYEEDKP